MIDCLYTGIVRYFLNIESVNENYQTDQSVCHSLIQKEGGRDPEGAQGAGILQARSESRKAGAGRGVTDPTIGA